MDRANNPTHDNLKEGFHCFAEGVGGLLRGLSHKKCKTGLSAYVTFDWNLAFRITAGSTGGLVILPTAL